MKNKVFESHNFNWIKDLTSKLNAQGFEFDFIDDKELTLIGIKNSKLIINFVEIGTAQTPENLIELQTKFYSNNLNLIHLWEDVFTTKPVEVIERIKSLTGKNTRIHGRKTNVLKITKPEADAFLNENHLQGSVSSRYKFGLFTNNELVAVATFSALRKMNHTQNYKSIELIRFAVKAGFSVNGGLSKLIMHVGKNLQPNDVMSYADRDWSFGSSYQKLGFEQVSFSKPQTFLLDENLTRTLVKDENPKTHPTVFNTGSIKFILKF
ncbi:hypothetical protein [Pedobacter aquatilis]|uniref:hypothetical protein n=1 Tax=Pedobacter aquatilis TaxID=351343 RepID=UPI00292CD7F3|nr:hypothetical protein [Pedobacter aquatilis]